MNHSASLLTRLRALGLSPNDLVYFVNMTDAWNDEEIESWLSTNERLQNRFVYDTAFIALPSYQK